MRTEEGLARVIEVYHRQGYYPSKWAHLHADLKKLIKCMKFRPGIKECYKNCQILMLGARWTELADRLEYHEGLALSSVGIPIEHAWLMLDGVVQDPTATMEGYLISTTFTAAEIRRQAVKTQLWTPMGGVQTCLK